MDSLLDFTVSTATSMLVEEGETFYQSIIFLVLFIIFSSSQQSTPAQQCGDSGWWHDGGSGEKTIKCEQNLGTWPGISSCNCAQVKLGQFCEFRFQLSQPELKLKILYSKMKLCQRSYICLYHFIIHNFLLCRIPQLQECRDTA